MEDIKLIKDIRQGCYSNDPEIRQNSGGGYLMHAGATYGYHPEAKQSNGTIYPAYYACGTHIIYARDIDWNMFIKASEYDEFIDMVKRKFDER